MKLSKIITIGLTGIAVWACSTHTDSQSLKDTISNLVKDELADFGEGFKKGYQDGLKDSNTSSTGTSVAYPKNVAERLELPRLSKESGQYFIVHSVDEEVNYSLEYDGDKHHCRWVAFTFDDNNSRDVVGRMDTWQWDPKLPTKLSTENDFKGSGYSRGHMVASEDRVSSKEANKQTFYYSNVSPQLQEHNAGIWKKLEEKVREWGRDSQFRKVMYIAKGGTIADGQVEEKRLRGKIVIPRYYFMAVLTEDHAGEYHAIGFLTEHRKYSKSESNLQTLALSIDELEKFTGLDFFHNVNDSTEEAVESVAPLSPKARQYWW